MLYNQCLMAERTGNICHESGCFGYCCSNMTFSITPSLRRRCFPGAIPATDDVNSKVDGPDGVYYSTSSSRGGIIVEWLLIKGVCPNLKNGACAVYEQRPPACRNFQIGSVECDEVRVDYNLSPVPNK